MKKTILAVLAVVGMLAIVPAETEAGMRATCRDSQLCLGLMSVLQFEEGSDFVRRDSLNGLDFLEPDGVDATNATGKVGTALSLDGSKYLYIPEGDIPPTVAVWYYQNDQGSSGTTQTIIGQRGVFDLRINDKKPELIVYKTTNDSAITLTWGSQMTTLTWHMVIVTPVFAQDANGNPYFKYQMWVDNTAAVQTSVITDPLKAHPLRKVSIGAIESGVSGTFTQFFRGRIDHMALSVRAWSPEDYSKFYNANIAQPFPFSTLP